MLYNFDEMIAAQDRGKARYLFYKKHFPGTHITDVPKVRTKKIASIRGEKPSIVTRNAKYKGFKPSTLDLYRVRELDDDGLITVNEDYILAWSRSGASSKYYDVYYPLSRSDERPRLSIHKTGSGFEGEPRFVTHQAEFAGARARSSDSSINPYKSKKEFREAVGAIADSVWDFHNYWGVGSNTYKDSEPTEKEQILSALSDRLWLLWEEVNEHHDEIHSEGEFDAGAALQELADVLYIVLGTLESVGEAGREHLERIIEKNKAKTRNTHEISNKPPHKIVKKVTEEATA